MANVFTSCCNEISRCCYDFYHAPFTKKNLLIAGGILAGIIIIIIICVATAGSSSSPPTANDILVQNILIDGWNHFPSTLKNISNNYIYGKDWQLTDGKLNFSEICVKKNSVYRFCQTDLKRLKMGKVSVQVWVADPSYGSQYKDAVSRTLEQIDLIKRIAEIQSPLKGYLVKSSSDIKPGKGTHLGSIIAVRGGHAIDSRLSVLRMYYDLGVRIMSLASQKNKLPVWIKENGDITEFGKRVIHQMNRLGMIIDLTGLASNAQVNVIKESKAPLIFSHSNMNIDGISNQFNVEESVLDNFTADKKGLLMVTFASEQIDKNQNKSIYKTSDVANQVSKVHKNRQQTVFLGVGSNFDSQSVNGAYLTDLHDSSNFLNFFKTVHGLKLGTQFLIDLAGGNFVKIFKKVEQVSKDMQKDKNAATLHDLERKEDPADIDESKWNTCNSDGQFLIPDAQDKPTEKPTVATTTITTKPTTKPNGTKT